MMQFLQRLMISRFMSVRREIGDMDEGIVEGGEDTGDTENEFTWKIC